MGLFDGMFNRLGLVTKAQVKNIQSDFLSKKISDYVETQGSLPVYNPAELIVPEISKELCYRMAETNDCLKNVLHIVNRETFKEGYVIKSKFVCKCIHCGKEYQKNVTKCNVCDATDLQEDYSKPNQKEKDILEKRLSEANRNGESICKLFSQIERDLNIIDEAYLLFGPDLDCYRINPLAIVPVINNQGLLAHSNDRMIVFKQDSRKEILQLEKGEQVPKGYLPADYKSKEGMFYSRTELFRFNKFSDSLEESYPPVRSLWDKLYMLIKMDEYLALWYAGKRASKGIIVFNTNDFTSMEKQLYDQQKLLKTNPHALMQIITEAKDATKLVDYIPLSPTPAELESEAQRDNMRRYIAGFYGVLPLYIGDVTNTGGLNNETQQLTITRDTILSNVRRYNAVLQVICDKLDIKDWIAEIKVPDEIEIPRRLEVEKKQLEVAKMKQDLGYDVEFDEDAQDWIIVGKKEVQNPNDVQGLDFNLKEDFTE